MSALLQNPLNIPMLCPYYRPEAQRCRVSSDTSPLGSRTRMRYCRSEDHEDCPLFLSRLLRNSAPGFRGELELVSK